MKNSKTYLIAGLALAVTTLSQAQVISWNAEKTGAVLGSAGVELAGNWNSTFLGSGTSELNLLDDSGGATTLDITFSSGDFAIQGSVPGVDADGSYNRNMLNGYMNAGGANSSTVSLTEIPYALYDIYVYFSSDTAGRTGTVSDGSSTFDFNTVGGPSISGTNALFLEATASTTGADAANYAVFSGLSGTNQDLTVTIPGFGGIAGFQVAAIPEPSTLILLSVALLGLITFRRR